MAAQNNNVEFTMEDVLKGLPTKIGNKEYLSTAEYVNPFLERMSSITDEFRVKVKCPKQITLDHSGNVIKENLTFNRVWVQAILPDEYEIDNHKKVIGFLYGIDCRKPVLKVYSGIENSACTNLTVFSPDACLMQEIEPNCPLHYDMIDSVLNMADDVAQTLKRYQEIEIAYNQSDVRERLGQWVDNAINKVYTTQYGKVKMATSDVIDAYKMIYTDPESPYYVGENPTTAFNIYNAFTQTITNDKDIMNRFEKTLLVKDILNF